MGWRALQHATESIRGNPKFVLLAMEQDAEAFRFATKTLQLDRSFALSAIENDGRVLKFVPPSLRADRRFVLDAVKMNKRALEYVDPQFKEDTEIMRAAQEQDVPTHFVPVAAPERVGLTQRCVSRRQSSHPQA
mmetsp:Transcript_3619/g.9293  ORF Transcript_3619/g.9293 Transcript_3619/m.9293 type:complete len:134 (-) Transcript_3619:129-530(-)